MILFYIKACIFRKTQIFQYIFFALVRCESYGDFGLLKKSTYFIQLEFCKRRHCPQTVTFFLQ